MKKIGPSLRSPPRRGAGATSQTAWGRWAVREFGFHLRAVGAQEGFKRGRDLRGQGHTGCCADRAMGDPGGPRGAGQREQRTWNECQDMVFVQNGIFSGGIAGVWSAPFSGGGGGGAIPMSQVFSSIPAVGLHLLEAVMPPPSVTTEMSLDIARCPLRGKTAPS